MDIKISYIQTHMLQLWTDEVFVFINRPYLMHMGLANTITCVCMDDADNLGMYHTMSLACSWLLQTLQKYKIQYYYRWNHDHLHIDPSYCFHLTHVYQTTPQFYSGYLVEPWVYVISNQLKGPCFKNKHVSLQVPYTCTFQQIQIHADNFISSFRSIL